jgi:putative endonuclease
MHYVYLLLSLKDNGLYIGYTNDLKRRFEQHNKGLSLSTKYRLPFKLVFYECFSNSTDARSREKYLKSGYGRQQLKDILKNTFNKV